MTILDMTSKTYLHRLVRLLNAHTDGFYTAVATFNLRCNRARLKNGVIEVRSPSGEPQWFVPSRSYFEDCYGREIVASVKS